MLWLLSIVSRRDSLHLSAWRCLRQSRPFTPMARVMSASKGRRATLTVSSARLAASVPRKHSAPAWSSKPSAALSLAVRVTTSRLHALPSSPALAIPLKGSSREPVGLPAPQRRLADGRPDAGFIETNAFGESRQVKASNVPPENYVPQGGRGMDQPTPFGQKYSNPMQARNAIQKAGAAATHEAVQVGPKQIEVRAKQPEVAPAIQFAAGQQWTHAGRLYKVDKVQADGRAHVSTPSPMPSRT